MPPYVSCLRLITPTTGTPDCAVRRQVYDKGKYSNYYFRSNGNLRHISRLRYWPLDRVLSEKYGLPADEVRTCPTPQTSLPKCGRSICQYRMGLCMGKGPYASAARGFVWAKVHMPVLHAANEGARSAALRVSGVQHWRKSVRHQGCNCGSHSTGVDAVTWQGVAPWVWMRSHSKGWHHGCGCRLAGSGSKRHCACPCPLLYLLSLLPMPVLTCTSACPHPHARMPWQRS
eukprot:364544-Chlamydomonas_euryale.AAC.1